VGVVVVSEYVVPRARSVLGVDCRYPFSTRSFLPADCGKQCHKDPLEHKYYCVAMAGNEIFTEKGGLPEKRKDAFFRARALF